MIPFDGRSPIRLSDERKRLILAVFLLFLTAVCLVGTLFFYKKGLAEMNRNKVNLEELDSPYAILTLRSTGEVLASRRGTERIYPASMTKIMTVLVALDQLKDLEQKVTLSADYFDALYEEDASMAGFLPGETTRILDLMYGAILPSGAECCKELALRSAADEASFVELMNRKGADLKLSDTHFTNTTGLHDPDHYTTPADMAKIVRAAMENETFYKIYTTHHYDVPPTDLHPEGFSFWSTLFQATVDEIVNGGEIMGGKTGFTEKAGHCLASFATISGTDYILVTAGVPESPRSDLYHIDDAFRAYNQIEG